MNDTYTVDNLVDVLRRAGFVPCDSPACNCGSWHHRYGLPERMAEIVEMLQDADVLNNSTGNLPTRAIAKLVAERDAARVEIKELLSALTGRITLQNDAEVEAAFRYGYSIGVGDYGENEINAGWREYQRERGTR